MKVIMWLIVFMVGCIVPLFIFAGIYSWYEKRWEKHNNKMHPQSEGE